MVGSGKTYWHDVGAELKKSKLLIGIIVGLISLAAPIAIAVIVTAPPKQPMFEPKCPEKRLVRIKIADKVFELPIGGGKPSIIIIDEDGKRKIIGPSIYGCYMPGKMPIDGVFFQLFTKTTGFISPWVDKHGISSSTFEVGLLSDREMRAIRNRPNHAPNRVCNPSGGLGFYCGISYAYNSDIGLILRMYADKEFNQEELSDIHAASKAYLDAVTVQ